MSHSTYLYGADAPVGTGIQKISDDIGAETGPTIGGLVNLIGGAGITVLGNPATNTIEITNTVVASEFQADDANIATPLAGVLAIEGTVHEIETSAPGALHTIKIGLPDDVAIANTLSVPDFLATNDAVITNNFTVGGASYLDAVTVYGAAIFNWGADLGTDPASVTNISGVLTLPDQLNGVLVTDGTGIVSGLAGTDGQLLIGGSGLAPAFASVTAGPGIVITAGPNTLAIETAQDAVATAYIADVGLAIPSGRTITVEGGTNISTSGVFSTLTVNLDDSIILAGSATIGTTLTANGATTLNGAVTINNTLNCANTALFQFPVTFSDNVAMSANLDINGTLNVDSNVTMQSNLDVVHNVSCFQLDVAADASVENNLAVGAGFALAASPNGVLQTGGTGIVSATNGTNGQVLIGGGTAPVWGTLESADGSIEVTYPGNNRINLAASGGGGSNFGETAFKCVMVNNEEIVTLVRNDAYGAFGGIWSVDTAYAGFDGHPSAPYITVGNGLHGTPSIYTVPSTGLYQFFVSVQIRKASGTCNQLIMVLAVDSSQNYFFASCNPETMYSAASSSTNKSLIYTGTYICPLNAGNAITVYAKINYLVGTSLVSPNVYVVGRRTSAGTPPNLPSRTWWSGIRIA